MDDFETGNGPVVAAMKEGETKRCRGILPGVNVGPFLSDEVPDNVRGGTVGRDNIPVILYEARIKKVNGLVVKEGRYAVMVPPNQDLGIVCAGCYKPGMSLWNNAKCVSCRTFANHLEPVLKDDPTDTNPNPKKRRKIPVLMPDGKTIVRKCQRIPDNNPDLSLANAVKRANSEPVVMGPKPRTVLDLKDVAPCDLLHALKGTLGLTTEHTDAILADISHNDLIHALKGRHPNGLAGFMNYMDLEDGEGITECLDSIDLKVIRAYVKEKDKVSRMARTLKKLR
jgi:hypothetical protein